MLVVRLVVPGKYPSDNDDDDDNDNNNNNNYYYYYWAQSLFAGHYFATKGSRPYIT